MAACPSTCGSPSYPPQRERSAWSLERLQALGHELRRPEADSLTDGLYELRTRHLRVNYRILYFFHGRTAVVLSHGLSKQRARVRELDIARAVWRKRRDEWRPDEHTADWRIDR